ncbi:MAG: Fe-S cluster assembly protein SufD [Bryobacteraceae bacterium]|jgi:Fe-S cluster assembly protein SufD
MTAIAEQTGAWLEAFTSQPPAEPWLQRLRAAAFQRFVELGFPTTHDEDWRFTNVAPIARTRFGSPATNWGPTPDALPAAFLNGRLAVASLPKGVRLGGPEDLEGRLGQLASYDRQAFTALNTAFLHDVAVICIERGAVVEEPIHFLYGAAGQPGSPVAFHPRILILAGAHSQSSIVETYAGSGACFTNAVTEIVAGDGAVVDHYKIQTEPAEAFHVATMAASLGRSANFSATSIALGGALVRNDVNVTLSEGTDAALNGLYVVNGSQHVDNHTSIDHAKPHGTSRELYKGILDGKSSAVFNGRILVRKDAQKTDSKQTNKNLVLSDEAVIDTKPELQIFADDVRCTHGATIGQLDAESMFYMQSRGIGKDDARNLLIYAFAQDVVDRIKVASLRDSLERILFEKLHERAR